ncbi:MAG: GNAT family N-acetyltransferase [Halobacteriovoraceae bacterium]|nr:GNAT family N-acetyltransferase [Halobacteriovoraceae bacterium]
MNNIIFESNRLIFKKPTLDDYAFIENCLENELLMKYMGGIWDDDFKKSFKDFLFWHWKTYNFGHYLVYLKKTKEVVGVASIKYLRKDVDPTTEGPDIGGFGISKHWNKGLGTEATIAILKYAFEILHINEIKAHNYDENTSSTRILQKIGFQKKENTNVNYNGKKFSVASSWEISKKKFLAQFSV